MNIKYIYSDYVYCYKKYKIHLFDVSEKKNHPMSYNNYIYKSFCNRTKRNAYRNIKDIIFNRYDYHTISISYKHICKFCLKKLPPTMLNKIKQDFIIAKLKSK